MRQSPTRRQFLGTTAATLLASKAVRAHNKQDQDTEAKAMGGYRYWMHGFGGENPKDMATNMAEMGFDIVVAGGEDTIAAVNDAGMESWLCGGAFGLGKYKDTDAEKAIDITGEAQVWFNSGSPNSENIRAQNREAYEKMAATEGVSGILVDGCRFASPASGLNAFCTDFSSHSKKKAAALGFDWDLIKHDVRALYDLITGARNNEPRRPAWLQHPAGILEWLTQHPGILEWLRFRRVCSTEHFRDLAEIIHGGGKRMGVYIFTPSIAPLVGQSYTDLTGFTDVFAPMIYRNYPKRPGPACLNWELTIIPEELGLADTPMEAPVMTMLLSWLGLAESVPAREIAHIQNAVPPEAVAHEVAMARAQLPADKELAPIIYIDDPEMDRTADLVRAHGADGVNFFVYKDAWADMVKPAF